MYLCVRDATRRSRNRWSGSHCDLSSCWLLIILTPPCCWLCILLIPCSVWLTFHLVNSPFCWLPVLLTPHSADSPVSMRSFSSFVQQHNLYPPNYQSFLSLDLMCLMFLPVNIVFIGRSGAHALSKSFNQCSSDSEERSKHRLQYVMDHRIKFLCGTSSVNVLDVEFHQLREIL